MRLPKPKPPSGHKASIPKPALSTGVAPATTPTLNREQQEQQAAAERLQAIVQRANEEYAEFTDTITDMKELYDSINQRIIMFNKNIGSLEKAYKNFYESLNTLSKKPRC